MARPAVGTLAEEALERLDPVAHEDEQLDWPLLSYLGALLGRAQEVADLARDSDDGPGWSAIVDPERAPTAWLPWTAQLVGVRMPPPGSPEYSELSEDAQRLRIRETDGQRRGSVGALKGAARQHLVGPDGTPDTATVHIFERHGSAYRLSVATLDGETPDPARVEAALLDQKPAGIVLVYDVIEAGGDYDALASTHSDYADVAATFVDYHEVLIDPTKQ